MATRRETDMIRPRTDADFDTIYAIVNQAAEAFRGMIPADRWHDPSHDDLRYEIESGVQLWGCESGRAFAFSSHRIF